MWFLKGSRRLLDFYLVSGIQWPIDHFFQFAVIDLSKAVIYPVFRVAVWMCRMAVHGFKIDCCLPCVTVMQYRAKWSLWLWYLSWHLSHVLRLYIYMLRCVCRSTASCQHSGPCPTTGKKFTEEAFVPLQFEQSFCDCSVMLNLSLPLDYFFPV